MRLVKIGLMSFLFVSIAMAGQAIAPLELHQKIKDKNAPLVLDVRTETEFSEGHIKGAMNIPHTLLRQRIAELQSSKSQPIIVHCETGYRAKIARAILDNEGFTQLLTLEGDWEGWLDAGLPVATP